MFTQKDHAFLAASIWCCLGDRVQNQLLKQFYFFFKAALLVLLDEYICSVSCSMLFVLFSTNGKTPSEVAFKSIFEDFTPTFL